MGGFFEHLDALGDSKEGIFSGIVENGDRQVAEEL
jgi:hypothetical protein